MRIKTVSLLIIVVATLLVNVSCSGSYEENFEVSGEDLVVFAASSLTDVFWELEKAFEMAYPEVNVVLNFASSSTLRTQIEQGASADVFMSANEFQMERAEQSDVIQGPPNVFATNLLTVITPAGEGSVNEISDLGNSNILLLLAGTNVPVGAYSHEAIHKMDVSGRFGENFGRRVLARVASHEPNVRAVIGKIVLGEADAGFVYITDLTPDVVDRVRAIPIPHEFNVVARYFFATVKDSVNVDAAEAFGDFLMGTVGQDILYKHGFGPIP